MKLASRDEPIAAYADTLIKEIELVASLLPSRMKVSHLHWGGGTPTFLNHDELMRLMGLVEENFNLSPDCEMSIEIDPRKVTNESLEFLHNIGFNRISLGVQDFDEKVQLAVNRVQSFDLVRERLQTARKLNIQSINMDLIYGLPFQTVKTFERTLDKVIDLLPDRLSIFNYAHLPERFKPQRRINEENLPSPGEKLEIFKLTMKKLQQAGYVYIGMDHFALQDDSMVKAQQEGSLQRNFQGYSTHAHTDLIGVGVSSIGSIFDSYSQNSSNMDDYRKMVTSGQLPVVRGLVMTADDRLRKQVINQLICHFALDIKALENEWHIDFASYFKSEIDELMVMAEDGLVTFGSEHIQVEPRGRLLIRNICMVFDAYLKDNVVKFSKVI